MAKVKRWLILGMAVGMAAGWSPAGIAQQPSHRGTVLVAPPSDKPSGRVTSVIEQPSPRSSLLLPQNFSGWQKKAFSVSTDPAQADAANSGALREFGFTLAESATYIRNGRKLQIKAARFSDDAGAFGAFSFYRQPEMQADQLGDGAVSDNDHIIFVRGRLLVQAAFERPSAMSAAALRSLASELPGRPQSSLSNPQPLLLDYLPSQGLEPNSARYILGPQAYAASALQSPLPASVVDFTRSPQIATARYTTPEGEAGVLVIEYPTPQIALERVRAIRDFLQHPASAPGSANGSRANAARSENPAPADISSPLTLAAGDDGEITLKRTGPLVSVIFGAISGREAKEWAASINYDAQVTWDEPTKVRPQDNIGNLIVGIFLLIGLLIAVFLLLVVFFGGLAVILRRFFPNYNFRGQDDMEIIKLNLRE